jgi:hypothetical protein
MPASTHYAGGDDEMQVEMTKGELRVVLGLIQNETKACQESWRRMAGLLEHAQFYGRLYERLYEQYIEEKNPLEVTAMTNTS